MKDIRDKITDISESCEDDIDFQERLIEYVIKPLAKEAFEAGEDHFRNYGYSKNYSDTWVKQNLK